MESYQQPQEALFTTLDTTPQGLTGAEAAMRLEQYGYNQLRPADKAPLWKLLLDAFKDPMMLILTVVVLIKLVLGEHLESIVIIIVLVVNALISVIQTRKAESSIEALRQISAPVAKVRRDGETKEVPAKELVPGDIVMLEAGDFVPADGRIIHFNALKIDEGLLTGESEPVLKHDDTLEGTLPLGDRKNMAYSGTMVVHGRGEIVITATGKQAEIGKIATLIETAQDRQTPLQRKLEDFGKKLVLVITVLCALIFGAQIVRALADGGNMFDIILHAFIFAVAVAVAAIPEALSSIVTIVLAVGTKKMATQNAIIRKLPAVEALGSAGVICTDKTGTLTQNKMTVVDYFLPGEDDIWDNLLLPAMALCNDAIIKPDGSNIGAPTETALLAFCDKSGKPNQALRDAHARLAELPFDSNRKLMSTINDMGEKRQFTKGAPDVLLARSTSVLINGEVRPLTQDIRDKFEAANDSFGRKALRVLAYATKIVQENDLSPEDEYDLTLIGLTAMVDPPRQEVYNSIAVAKAAHIKTVMITGDHKNTAYAIAKEIGILDEDSGDIAITGVELDAMPEAELDEKLENIAVYARVSPENKITIVKAWQRKGMITAMTGDGVNDAPSLKQADIGVAMGSGTEVSKDASAMILTDDNFTSIVNAVAIGRTIFDNIKKAIGYLFSGNLAAIIAIMFAFAMGWDSPLTALQILFINLVNDSIPAIAIGLEAGEPTVMSRPPRDMNEGILGDGLFAGVLIRGIIIGVVAIAAQMIGVIWFTPAIGGAMAFTTLILARTFQTFSARSNSQTLPQLGLFSNPYTVLAVGVCLGLYGLTLLPQLRGIFHIGYGFGLYHWGIAVGLAVGAVVVMEVIKLVRSRM